MCSCSVCALSPSAPRPSSVGTPTAEVKLASLPPPVMGASSRVKPAWRADACARTSRGSFHGTVFDHGRAVHLYVNPPAPCPGPTGAGPASYPPAHRRRRSGRRKSTTQRQRSGTVLVAVPPSMVPRSPSRRVNSRSWPPAPGSGGPFRGWRRGFSCCTPAWGAALHAQAQHACALARGDALCRRWRGRRARTTRP